MRRWLEETNFEVFADPTSFLISCPQRALRLDSCPPHGEPHFPKHLRCKFLPFPAPWCSLYFLLPVPRFTPCHLLCHFRFHRLMWVIRPALTPQYIRPHAPNVVSPRLETIGSRVAQHPYPFVPTYPLSYYPLHYPLYVLSYDASYVALYVASYDFVRHDVLLVILQVIHPIVCIHTHSPTFLFAFRVPSHGKDTWWLQEATSG
jgi:hypothetical protein